MVNPIKTLLACLIFLMPVRVVFAFGTINDDILSNLFLLLKPARSEMPNLSLVCKHWHKVLNDKLLWTKFLELDFGLSTRQIQNKSACLKAYYFRLKNESSTVEDVLAIKSWPQEKMVRILASDESDKIEILLSRHLERAVLKEAWLVDVDSPVKLESFFYAYYETIADLIVEIHDVAKNIIEPIVGEKNNDLAYIVAMRLMSDYLVDNGMWAQSANGIRNAAHKGYTNKNSEDFFCRVGEHIRQRILNSNCHENGHAAIKRRFFAESIPFKILSEQPPEKIGIIIAKVVSLYWLAALAQPDYFSTYLKGAYFFALKEAQTKLKNIEEEFPEQEFLKEHVMQSIEETAWPVELLNNPHAQSFKVIMETIAHLKDDKTRDSEKD